MFGMLDGTIPEVIQYQLSDRSLQVIRRMVDLAENQNQYNPALIYSISSGAYYLSEKRKSQKLRFTSHKLKEYLVSKVIKEIVIQFGIPKIEMLTDDGNDHFDLITYGPGGHFDTHCDMEIGNIPNCQQYTMLIGLLQTEEGGETELHTSNGIMVVNETCRPGGIVLFRSSMPHSGRLVTVGHKKLLMASVFLPMSTFNYYDDFYDDCNGD
jgi:hypothetical protein